MFKNISKLSVLLFSALVLVFFASVFIYFFLDDVHVSRTFFFPGLKGELSGETRRLPEKKLTEDKIEQFVEELILGPFDVNHNRLIPKETRLMGIMFRNQDTVYLNFSADFVILDGSTSLSYQEMISGIKRNIEYNFPFIKHIIVSVDGEHLKLES